MTMPAPDRIAASTPSFKVSSRYQFDLLLLRFIDLAGAPPPRTPPPPPILSLLFDLLLLTFAEWPRPPPPPILSLLFDLLLLTVVAAWAESINAQGANATDAAVKAARKARDIASSHDGC